MPEVNFKAVKEFQEQAIDEIQTKDLPVIRWPLQLRPYCLSHGIFIVKSSIGLLNLKPNNYS